MTASLFVGLGLLTMWIWSLILFIQANQIKAQVVRIHREIIEFEAEIIRIASTRNNRRF